MKGHPLLGVEESYTERGEAPLSVPVGADSLGHVEASNDTPSSCYNTLAGPSRPGDRPPLAGGKSELRRAGCWVTPRRGNPTESATETYRQRSAYGAMRARVKW